MLVEHEKSGVVFMFPGAGTESQLAALGFCEKAVKPSILLPAIANNSYQIFRDRREKFPQPLFYMGHSLGEFIACMAAGVFSEDTGLELIYQFGRILEQRPGQMVVASGKDLEEVKILCESAGARLASINSPKRFVVSRIEKSQKIEGVALSVEAPCHCDFMKPLHPQWRQLVGKIKFYKPQAPLILNADAKPTDDNEAIKEGLIKQFVSTVLWQQSAEEAIRYGACHFAEFGSEVMLLRFVSRINRNVTGELVTNKLVYA